MRASDSCTSRICVVSVVASRVGISLTGSEPSSIALASLARSSAAAPSVDVSSVPSTGRTGSEDCASGPRSVGASRCGSTLSISGSASGSSSTPPPRAVPPSSDSLPSSTIRSTAVTTSLNAGPVVDAKSRRRSGEAASVSEPVSLGGGRVTCSSTLVSSNVRTAVTVESASRTASAGESSSC